MLSIVQIGRNKGNEDACKNPPHRFQLRENAVAYLKPEIPDVDYRDSEHIERISSITAEYWSERSKVEQADGYEDQDQDVYADMNPGKSFPIRSQIHLIAF